MPVSVEITKWYQNKDVAFAIGVDELNTGGSFKDSTLKMKSGIHSTGLGQRMISGLFIGSPF